MNDHALLIKRYPNRKLYNTETSSYVNLKQIAAMVEAGTAVTILDNKSGEDLTRMMLAQIMVEKEKQSRRTPTSEFWQRFFPMRNVPFNELIDKVRRATSREKLGDIQEDLEKQIQKWVAKGQVTKDEIRSYMEKVQAGAEQFGQATEETVTGFWERLVSHGNESSANAILDKLDALEKRLTALEKKAKDKA